MKEQFVNSSINFIKKYQECDDLKIKKLRYGLEGIYSLFVKLTVVFIIALLSNTLIQTLLFLLFYAGIRTFSFGLHAKSNIACWISTIAIYNVIPLLIKNYNFSDIVGYIIIGASLIGMMLWAPADTPKRPLIRKKQRTKCKIFSITVVLIYAIIFYISKSNLITNTLVYSLIVQSILINPITYKITNTRFNNYKYYKK